MRNMSLRVIRELIKSRPPGVTKFTEELTTVVLECFKDKDCNVSQAAEDLFTPLSNALPPQRMMDILGPIVNSNFDTDVLGALKLLSKVGVALYLQYIIGILSGDNAHRRALHGDQTGRHCSRSYKSETTPIINILSSCLWQGYCNEGE